MIPFSKKLVIKNVPTQNEHISRKYGTQTHLEVGGVCQGGCQSQKKITHMESITGEKLQSNID